MKRSIYRSNHAILLLGLGLACCLSGRAGTSPVDTGAKPPTLIGGEEPKWPFKMRFGSDGSATICFVVTQQGSVENIRVMFSSSPDMEAPCVAALLQTRFAPGLRNGSPAAFEEARPFFLKLYTGNSSIRGPHEWGVSPRALKDAPPAFQYDRAPFPILTLPAVYPRELIKQGVKGSATVAMAIDPTGRPRQVVVADSSNPEFGAATAAMMATWRFSPARREGFPCWAMVSMKQMFDLNDEDVGTDDDTERIVRALNAETCPIVGGPAQLDRAPVALYAPPPAVPDDIRKAGVPAQAEIEVVVDREGHAQLPRIVSASRPDFGWAAATAAGRWQFSIPTSGGKAVDVLLRLPFSFDPLRSDGGPGREVTGVVTGSQPRKMAGTVRLDLPDEQWKKYVPYLQGLVSVVQVKWRQVSMECGIAYKPGQQVKVPIGLDYMGQVLLLDPMESTPGTEVSAEMACLMSVLQCGGYPWWTDEMKHSFPGHSSRLTLRFTYR